MKRILPHTRKERVFQSLFAHRFHILWSILWFISMTGFVLSWSKQPEQIEYSTLCSVKTSVQKGELLKLDQVEKKSIPAKDVPENAVTNCTQKELATLPLTHDVQNGDVLQLSTFEKPEELLTFTDQLPKDTQLFSLPIKDIHSLPFNLEPGITIDILAKNKKAEDAEVLLSNVTVVDLRIVKDQEKQSVTDLILAVDEKQALSLTKAIADQAVLAAVEK